MNWTRPLLLLLAAILFSAALQAQDTLPRFSVINPGNGNIIIGWTNNHESLKQISIQTSHDSLKNYRTILTVTDPNSRQNGFADSKALNDHMYYRLFVVQGDGQYYFTEAKQPVLDTAALSMGVPRIQDVRNGEFKRPDFIPSFYVYTNSEGYVYINLPDAARKNYRIRFYEDDDSFLFEVKDIKETGLTLDKVNFVHAGWFKFELFNGESLVEKNKIYLSKDF